jgi:voltage-gated potassium channel
MHIRSRVATLVDVPLLRRVAWHVQRIRGGLDRRFFLSLAVGLFVVVGVAAALITLVEKPWTLESFGDSFYWGLTTIFGQGDSGFVKTPAGWAISWLLILFGVAILGTITGALVAAVIDFLLKEGQGMGAAGYRGHVVVCGWNATARDIIQELKGDEYRTKIVLIHDAERSPAGDGVYYVKGDPSEPNDLARAGISEASAAIVFPTDDSNDADMRNILVVMAIETIAPEVRTVVEINNARHAVHFRRAHADEILVTSVLASHLLARSALYPGLTELVTDIVSGGKGSELYRVELPAEFLGMSVNDVSTRLRLEHRATLLSIGRGEEMFTNPPADFRVESGDHALVVAESLGTLAPLKMAPSTPAAPAPSESAPATTPTSSPATPAVGVPASAPATSSAATTPGAPNGTAPLEAAPGGATNGAAHAAHPKSNGKKPAGKKAKRTARA